MRGAASQRNSGSTGAGRNRALLRGLKWHFHRLCCLPILWSLAVALAQAAPPDGVAVRSVSGQFVVQAGELGPASLANATLAPNPAYAELDPMLLLVSCERVKQILARELVVTSPWRGKIFISLFTPSAPDDGVLIHAQFFRNAWEYQVQMPRIVERTRLVRALVSVVLLEIANRRAGEHSAELPAWLVEGLAARLLATSESEIILPLPARGSKPLNYTPLILNSRQENPLDLLRKKLGTRAPLNFENLCWPSPAQLDGADGGLYKLSAQLFVHQLMLLENGREGLGRMLAMLPEHLNWQFAFLRAYQDRFPGLLDVEKWWSLQIVNFTGREMSETWPAAESWLKLSQALRCRVQIRSAANNLPQQAEIPLQTVIRDWTPQDQVPLLQSKLQELELLKMRVSATCLPTAESYSLAIRGFLENAGRGSFLPFRRQAHRRNVTAETLKTLDFLDHQRQAIPPTETEMRPSSALSSPISNGQ